MFYLKRNLPLWERTVRIALALLILVLLWFTQVEGIWRWVGLVLAASTGLTAITGFCPACAMAGRTLDDKKI